MKILELNNITKTSKKNYCHGFKSRIGTMEKGQLI